MSSFSFIPGNGLYFPFKEAKVGNSWQIPINIQKEEFNFTGTINNEITEILSATVPAGTYEVFKLEISSSDLTIRYENPSLLNMTEPAEIRLTMEGYECFEKETCRVVEAKFDMTTTTTIMGETMSFSMTINMKLVEHIK